MAGSDTITQSGQVLAPLTLTTSEDTYTFSFPTLAKDSQQVYVQLVADVDWHYSHETSADYYPIYAGIPFDLKVTKGLVIYVKGISSGGTLSLVVKDGAPPASRTNS